MKKLWSKKWPKVLAVVLACVALAYALDATGGKMAQPERVGPDEDTFVGFQMVFERMPQEGESIPRDESHWVEYGAEDMAVDGLGTISFPRKILIGEYNEAEREYVFPGLEGINCFQVVRKEDGSECYTGHNGLADVHIKVGDQENSLSGTVYYGPPEDDANWNTENYDYGWTAYRVYQMDDGTVYLDGSGDSFGGMGGFTVTKKESWTETVDGEETTASFEVSVTMTSVERIQEVLVTWFDETDQPLENRSLTMEEIGEGLTLNRPQGAVWAMVTETDRLGTDKRTAYTLEEEEVSHQLVQLDACGLGRLVYLTLT